jgi:uncharacterized membrane protein
LTLVFAGVALVILAVAATALLIGFRAELEQMIDQGLLSRLATMRADPLVEIAAIPKGDESFALVIRSDGTVE